MHGKYNIAGVAADGWIIFMGLREYNIIAALTLGGAAIAISFIMIAMTQLARALIDTAQANAQILALMQRQAEKHL